MIPFSLLAPKVNGCPCSRNNVSAAFVPFSVNKEKGIKLEGFTPKAVNLADGYSADDLWVHDEKDIYKAQILVRIFDNPGIEGHLPRPFGVFYQTDRSCYENVMEQQIKDAIAKKPADLDKLLRGNEVWVIN